MTAAGQPQGESGCRSPSLRPLRGSVGLLVVGIGMLNAANAGWCHLIGVLAFTGFTVVGFVAIVPRAFAADDRLERP